MQNLHVVFAVDRAGLVGEDGETHHGLFDVGFLRQAPGMTILAPASCKELRSMLHWAVKEQTGPVAIRYPRGGDGNFTDDLWSASEPIVLHRQGTDCAILTYGTMINACMDAAEILKEQGIDASVIRLTQLSNLPVAQLKAMLDGIANVYVVEEISHNSGISDSIRAQLGICCTAIDLGNEFVTHGSVTDLYEKYGLDPMSIAKKVQEVFRHEN